MKASFLNHGCLLALALAVLQTGCGSKETAQTPASGASTSRTALSQDASPESDAASEAEAVVSHFLDRIRRGGENHDAMSLLTDQAQAELRRIGQVVQPIGSPDASFQVTRSSPMPSDETSRETSLEGRLVHCLWTEPAPASETGEALSEPQTFQVVWSVFHQKDGWKISGLVLEMNPQEPPLVLDFENGNLMAKILSGQPDEQTAKSPDSEDANPVR